MSTEVELLSLAAKAIGYRVKNSITNHRDEFIGIRVKADGKPSLSWNPLTDDGDALRLAIDLRIRIEHSAEPGDDIEGVWADNTCVYVNGDLCNGDRRKAAREAIVLVAAERGRAIPDCWNCLGTGREMVGSHGEYWDERCNHCGGTGIGEKP